MEPVILDVARRLMMSLGVSYIEILAVVRNPEGTSIGDGGIVAYHGVIGLRRLTVFLLEDEDPPQVFWLRVDPATRGGER